MAARLLACIWLMVVSAGRLCSASRLPTSRINHVDGSRLLDTLDVRPVGALADGESQWEDATCADTATLEAAVGRFAKMLTFRTISLITAPLHVDQPEEWARLDTWLRTAYPLVFSSLQVEKVGAGRLSYLMSWQGSNPNLTPLLFISHLDVVPVPKETLANWTHPPFSGAIAEGYVWGRGALDVKCGVAGLLEAATLLLADGWTPLRTLYFGFGHDEEVGGQLGAAHAAELLRSRNVTVDMIWDEGGTIAVDGFQPYTLSNAPVALVGTAEKGYATILLHIITKGGHSSIPPMDGTSMGSIAGRILTAVTLRPPPSSLQQPVLDFVRALAPVTPGWRGQLFRLAGHPFVSDLVTLLLAHDTPETAAMVHTTVAVTGLEAGIAENVMPPGGTIRLNFRLLPGASIDSLTDYLQDVLKDDFKYVRLEPSPGQEGSTATPVTPASSPYFARLAQAIKSVWRLQGRPEQVVIVAPYLMPGGTDSKHYLDISKGGALRSVPTSMNRTAGDLSRVHGLNERLAVADFERAVCTYKLALQLFADFDG